MGGREFRGGEGASSTARGPAERQRVEELVDVTPAAAAEVDGGPSASLFMRNHFPARPSATLQGETESTVSQTGSQSDTQSVRQNNQRITGKGGNYIPLKSVTSRTSIAENRGKNISNKILRSSNSPLKSNYTLSPKAVMKKNKERGYQVINILIQQNHPRDNDLVNVFFFCVVGIKAAASKMTGNKTI